MLILVANLGSTSFKYKLLDMPAETQLASGSADRVGSGDSGNSAWKLTAGDQTREGTADLSDHAAAIELHLQQLTDLGVLTGDRQVQAIGFKAVHGGPIHKPTRVDDDLLKTMQAMVPLAPAHNPPYIAAMRGFAQRLPGVDQVACFETAFHASIPKARRVYGVPAEWEAKYGVRRYGFHGASHKYIASRMTHIEPKAKKIISLHLGGSCSVCAIDHGRSVAHSMGATPQTGVFHANRVGDLDTFAIVALREQGVSDDEIWNTLSNDAGLKGLSGISADLRDVRAAAGDGNPQAKLAVEAFVESCRHYVGAFLAALGGADALVFTGGIGQHEPAIRQAVCRDMDFAGIEIDRYANAEADPAAETRVNSEYSNAQVWVLPTNEELIVARQTYQTLEQPLAA
jgi:acetate kinase